MDYLIIIGIIILISVSIGFYIFYCRLNDNNLRVKELERNVRIIETLKPCKEEDGTDKKDCINSIAGNNNSNGNNNGKNNSNGNGNGNGSSNNNSNNGNNNNGNNSIDSIMNGCNNSNSNSIHGNIVSEQKIPINICANSEPEPEHEHSECTNYGPIPEEIDDVSIHNINIENMSEYPADFLTLK